MNTENYGERRRSLTTRQRWVQIAGVLAVGLFVAYIDRTNLSVALTGIAGDLGFAGEKSADLQSLALTGFNIGYALANIIGGWLTRRWDPKKTVVWMFILWSGVTVVIGCINSIAILVCCRVLLGVAEGVYWPQQSRFAQSWFAPQELTKANSIIQFYGQFAALALGYLILTPIFHGLGWRPLFWITGGIGLVLIVPLYQHFLRPQSEAPYYVPPEKSAGREDAARKGSVSFADLGGGTFVLMCITYITQGMLFWGITLWIPQAVADLGFTGMGQALGTAIPYFVVLVLAFPIARFCDRTGLRAQVASAGLLIAGVCLLILPYLSSPGVRLALISVAMGVYAASFTPNIWSILQLVVKPHAVGTASGIMNGLGAGLGGTIAGFLVGRMQAHFGGYSEAFAVLGGLVFVGGFCLIATYRNAKREGLRIDASEREVAARTSAQSAVPTRQGEPND